MVCKNCIYDKNGKITEECKECRMKSIKKNNPLLISILNKCSESNK